MALKKCKICRFSVKQQSVENFRRLKEDLKFICKECTLIQKVKNVPKKTFKEPKIIKKPKFPKELGVLEEGEVDITNHPVFLHYRQMFRPDFIEPIIREWNKFIEE